MALRGKEKEGAAAAEPRGAKEDARAVSAVSATCVPHECT